MILGITSKTVAYLNILDAYMNRLSRYYDSFFGITPILRRVDPVLNNLYVAAQNGELNALDLELTLPAVANEVAKYGNHALHLAAVNGHLNAVNRLLEFPAVVNQQAIGLNVALNLAFRYGYDDIVSRLIEFPAVRGFQILNDGPCKRLATEYNEKILDRKKADGLGLMLLNSRISDCFKDNVSSITGSLPPELVNHVGCFLRQTDSKEEIFDAQKLAFSEMTQASDQAIDFRIC